MEITSLGAEHNNRKVGTFGDAGCFSLGAGKLISGGEGGILVTKNQDLFERAVQLTQHPLRQFREGIIPPSLLSLNFRIHPVSAAIAKEKMGSLENLLKMVIRNAETLSQTLSNVPGISPVGVKNGYLHVYHKYSPTYIKDEWDGVPKEKAISALVAEGIPICNGYIQNPLSKCSRTPLSYPITESRCSDELGIGTPVSWKDDLSPLFEEIKTAIIKVYENRSKLP